MPDFKEFVLQEGGTMGPEGEGTESRENHTHKLLSTTPPGKHARRTMYRYLGQ